MKVIGAIDIGGTNIKYGIAFPEGKILQKELMPYAPKVPFSELVNLLSERLKILAAKSGSNIKAIAISSPGYIHPQTGVLLDGANNVPSLQGYSLTQGFENYLNVPAYVENDGTCAALGELYFGAGRNYDNFVVITLGTGIGGGVIINRQILKGKNGEPAEIGAICLDPRGPVNYSGIPGTFESLACASGILSLYQKLSEEKFRHRTIREIIELAEAGEETAKLTIDKTGQYIAQALGIMINLLNLEACIIGGGISAAGSLLTESIQKHLPSFTWPLLLKKAKLLLAELGNDAGLLGAVAMVKSKMANY